MANSPSLAAQRLEIGPPNWHDTRLGDSPWHCKNDDAAPPLRATNVRRGAGSPEKIAQRYRHAKRAERLAFHIAYA